MCIRDSFEGMEVPEELKSGNQKIIAQWREEQAIERTKNRRPDLLQCKTKIK